MTGRAAARGPLLRLAVRLLLAMVAALAVGLGLFVGALVLDGDPDRVVAGRLPDVAAAVAVPYAGHGCRAPRRCQDVILDPAAERPLRIALSLPGEAGPEPLPVVILVGGLRTGREALRHLPDLGPNAVITYEYPLGRNHWRRGFLPIQAVSARGAALAVPRQLAAVVRWARAQPWADPDRVSLVGVSLGALVLPAALHAAAAHGEALGPSILAYGGTDLFAILRANLMPRRPWLGLGAAWLASLGLRPLEPALHLPHLAGQFLLINGRDDPRIPPASAEGLQRLTPDPKEIHVLAAGHIDTTDQALLDAILALCRSWLVDRHALNP